MAYMIDSLTSWFKEEKEINKDISKNVNEGEEKKLDDNDNTKSINLAKDIGTYFYSFGKLAADQVTKSAKQLKVSIEENTIIGEFSKEQERFVNTNLEKKKQSEVAVPPWIGYNNEEELKTQILALSHDKRNVLRSPPSGIGFSFDYESSFPVAMVMLQEDQELNNLRFELVPKQIKEVIFWRNYFYRVSLILQSTEISTITASLSSSINDEVKEKEFSNCVEDGGGTDGIADAEFASDLYLTLPSPQDEELHKAIQQLNHETIPNDDPNDDISAWESELQAELQEYEVVEDENNLDVDIEQAILNQLSEDI